MEVSSAVSVVESVSLPLQEDNSGDVFDEDKLKETLSGGTLEFEDWTWLISEIECSFPDDIEKLCLVYDAFLSEFPLCHGYWRKYACHKMRLCTLEKVVEIFERAVQAATYSVAVWVDYCTFGVAVFEDPNDVRRLFERGLSFVGKDYFCHTLWDKYMEFLSVQEQWSSLAHIYLRTLRYPSKKLHLYYESFQKLVALVKEEIRCKITVNGGDLFPEPIFEGEVPSHYTNDEITKVVRDLLAPSTDLAVSKALQAYSTIGEQFYHDAHALMEKIHGFETQIRRPYFHVKPLDINQLSNWHEYLNFAETCGDFDWAIKLYERCLIPCADYPEFWIRYVDFVESKGGREIANLALTRASQTFLKNASVIHLFNARFKEQIGDISSAFAALSQCGKETSSDFVENVIKKANMERRLGDFKAAANTFREALEEISAGKEKMETLPMLYVHFSRLNYVMTNNADSTREILIDGIEKVPHCKLLFEELIRFTMMHGGSQDVDLLDSIIDKAILSGSDSSGSLSAEDKEDISNLFMELVDLCGTIHDVRKVWKRHMRLFPHSMGLKPFVCPAVSKEPFKGFMKKNRKIPVGSAQGLPPEKEKELPPESDANQLNDIATGHVNPDVRPDHINREPNLVSLASGLEVPRESVVQMENHGESQADSKGLSLERLSLSSKDNGPVTKRAHFLINPAGARESDAIEIQPSGSLSPSSSPVEPVQEQEPVRHSSQSLHRRSYANRDSNRRSRERPLQRQTGTSPGILCQQLQVVPLDSQAQPQNPTFTPYAEQAALQKQSPLSASQLQLPSQPAVAYPQAQAPQNSTIHGNDQHLQVQNNEAYNQMWQQYYYNYYYYYQHQHQQQLQTQQLLTNQNSQPIESSQQLLPEQYHQHLLQLHRFFQQQPYYHSEQSQAESQHPPSQQRLEQPNELKSPIQQSQEQQTQQQQQQQQQWFLQQQQYWQPQQQQLVAQQPYPQQQTSYEQQQQVLLYLQQQPPPPQPQREERREEQQFPAPTRDVDSRESQEYTVASTMATSGSNASALSQPPLPPQSPGGL